ncbi:uncharacterized protein LY89DRAFT_631275 [Mollisia scopiformis]|uniref:Rhodopsin domain-containing protein n=1 Tax=Mollisia scopiformis TaxID=149040 RepID=A0A132B7K3_MOLSC|nr:uncharacterized protein LY89DRAFT_631275 [Mollisia scopiformis]KUJ07657.1 hypothetical protein LY89DRAFT_631275 [Mollisia scopiformis]
MGFTDVEDLNSRQFTLLTWFMWGTGLLLTTLRFAVRYHYFRDFFWDDFFQVIGMLSLTALAVVTQLQRDKIYALKAAAPPDGDPAERTYKHVITDATRDQAKLQFASIFLFWICLWAIKGSLLMFYRRLFYNLPKYMKWWWAAAVACIATFIACVLTNFLECLPMSHRFELDLQGSCPTDNGIRFVATTTTLDILTDIFLMALPIKLLIGLRISMKQKIGVGVMFTLSILIVIFSAIRVSEIYTSLSQLDPNLNVSLALWSILEAAVAVVVGALPSLKSLMRGKRDSSYGSHTRTPKGPYLRSTNAGTKGSRASKALDPTTSASENGRGKQRDVEDLQGDEIPLEALPPTTPDNLKRSGIMRTRDIVISSYTPKSMDSRDEVTIESFIRSG